MASFMPPPPSRPPKSSDKPPVDGEREGERPTDSSHGLMPPPPPRPPTKPLAENVPNEPSSEADVPAQLAAPAPPETNKEDVGREEPKKNDEQRCRLNSSFNSSIYTIPKWSAAPAFPFSLEVIKDGLSVENLDIAKKGAYMFGRSDQCDFVLEHPSISRFHAVLQFKRPSDAFIYDLGSTHGTVVNKKKVLEKAYIPIHVGDVLKFGLSSRLYVLQGPDEFMPKEAPCKAERQLLREVQNAMDLADQEASLVRAKREAIQNQGASWGMMEDAFEEETNEEEEITWQNYKGQLTEKQQKTLDKILKRNEKIASLKREIDAIQVKEIPQGGLTQGQQMQVARNQQRIEQLVEELDNLEATLNQSIQESMGARGMIKTSGKGEEEEEDPSDEDDFYDRTITGKSKGNTKGESAPVVETAVSLLEKKEQVMKEIERLSELVVSEEENKSGAPPEKESQDPLDAFMTSVSTRLESDRVLRLRKEIEKEEKELERIKYLLKLADPSGEEQKKWERSRLECPMQVITQKQVKEAETKLNVKNRPESTVEKDYPYQEKKKTDEKNVAQLETPKSPTAPQVVDEQQEKKNNNITKGPLWLGHARKEVKDNETKPVNTEEDSDDREFLEYKERHNAAQRKESQEEKVAELSENTAGLIIRKTKTPGKKDKADDKQQNEESIMEGAAIIAADTVAMLLRHQRGLGAIEQEFLDEEKQFSQKEDQSTTKRRKLGPEKPDFLNKEDAKFQAWMPPTGQTGDGRTSLNDKYGY